MYKLQCLTGLLNFLSQAVVPGRTFTRRFYDKMIGIQQHHHLRVDRELREDLMIWKDFLKLNLSLCRPYLDFEKGITLEELNFYTDASKSSKVAAFGVVFQKDWTYGIFPDWILKSELTKRQTLQMYALTVGVVLVAKRLKNKRVTIFCDNQAVVAMIINGTSRCKTCMEFIRIVVKTSMHNNVRFFARYVKSEENGKADALSRLEFNRFRLLATEANQKLLPIPNELWPLRKYWWGTH